MSGSSMCPLEYRGCTTPGGWVTPQKTCIFRGFGAAVNHHNVTASSDGLYRQAARYHTDHIISDATPGFFLVKYSSMRWTSRLRDCVPWLLRLWVDDDGGGAQVVYSCIRECCLDFINCVLNHTCTNCKCRAHTDCVCESSRLCHKLRIDKLGFTKIM